MTALHKESYHHDPRHAWIRQVSLSTLTKKCSKHFVLALVKQSVKKLSVIYIYPVLLRFSASIYLFEDQFVTRTGISFTMQWIHIVLNYIGSDNGEGIKLYQDGTIVGSDYTKEATTKFGSPILRRPREWLWIEWVFNFFWGGGYEEESK